VNRCRRHAVQIHAYRIYAVIRLIRCDIDNGADSVGFPHRHLVDGMLSFNVHAMSPFSRSEFAVSIARRVAVTIATPADRCPVNGRDADSRTRPFASVLRRSASQYPEGKKLHLSSPLVLNRRIQTEVTSSVAFAFLSSTVVRQSVSRGQRNEHTRGSSSKRRRGDVWHRFGFSNCVTQSRRDADQSGRLR
jgi:hypothetical protein